MSARKVAQFTVPPELDQDYTADVFMDWLKSVERAGVLATVMLSKGIFSVDDNSILDSCIEAVAEQEFDAKAIGTKIERLQQQLESAPLNDQQRRAVASLSDAVFTDAVIAYGEAGFLLGLVVGQRVDLGKMGGAR